MKPFLSESRDNEALQALGRASVQIVHDLKNQLNGLKLYATFLRKRFEKSERPPDELETIVKLIAGLDRTAADLSLLVEYGQPVELKKRPETDLQKIMHDVAARLNNRTTVTGSLSGAVAIDTQADSLVGEFDPLLLAQALESISMGAMTVLSSKAREGALQISVKDEAIDTTRNGLIEWPVSDALDHDPFHSFAGSDEIRLSLAARIIEAHGGSAERRNGALCVRLPLTAGTGSVGDPPHE